MGKVYHKWTTDEERVIKDAYRYGRRKGIVAFLCDALEVTDTQLEEHIRKMRKGGRL